MAFNLIQDKFLFAKHRSGKRSKVALWEITGQYDTDPIVVFDAPLADLNGAAYQFAISMLQFLFPPATESEWLEDFHKPPTPDELRDILLSNENLASAFDIDGDNHRFMQDAEAKGGKPWSISQIILQDTSGHFQKDLAQTVSIEVAALLLLSQQLNTPNSAAGKEGQHRSSLRSGGPLTTIVMGENLWQTLWGNVLPEPVFNRICGDSEKNELSNKLPWMGKTRDSKDNINIYPVDAHPLAMYFSTVRRTWFNCVRLDNQKCDILEQFGDGTPLSGIFVDSLETKPFGNNYDLWLHPLSPYRDADNSISFYKPQNAGMIGYRHWSGIVVENQATGVKPAPVVRYVREYRSQIKQIRDVCAFGFATENAKILNYIQSFVQIYSIPDKRADNDCRLLIEKMIQAAEQANFHLCSSVQRAWGYLIKTEQKGKIKFAANRRKIDPKKLQLTTGNIASEFWHTTEAMFNNLAQKAHTALSDENFTDAFALSEQIRGQWFEYLQQTCMDIFHRNAENRSIQDNTVQRIAEARHYLVLKLFAKQHNELRSILELPISTENKSNTDTSITQSTESANAEF
jgi:CRISPR system Cascade subunit CasA